MTRSDAFSETPFDDGVFSDTDWNAYLEGIDIPHLNQWMRQQAARGQNYYLARLDRVMLRGERALDAGCGVGNWALALARRFREVVCIDNDAERIGVLSGISPRLPAIKASVGSVLETTFPDQSFDTVFCNGVVFLTDTERALREFARVLKPGGILYVTYNGPGWWRHLIAERAASDPVCYTYAANGLVDWAFALNRRLAESLPPLSMPRLAHDDDVDRLLCACLDGVRRATLSEEQAVILTDLVNCLADLDHPGIPPVYRARVARDLRSWLSDGHPDHEVEIHTHTFRPEEMAALLKETGFTCVQSAHEGSLVIDPEAAWAAPIYTSAQHVYESIARRGASSTA